MRDGIGLVVALQKDESLDEVCNRNLRTQQRAIKSMPIFNSSAFFLSCSFSEVYLRDAQYFGECHDSFGRRQITTVV